MGAFAGPADWWTDGTNDGRTHIATKGIVQSGLVLNLDAGVSSSYPGSGTTWTDLSGQGHNGALVGGVGFNGSNGGSLSFDGVNDYISLGTQNFITQDFSLEMWFRVSAATKEVYFFSFGYNDQNSLLIFRGESFPYNLLFLYFNGGSGTSFDSGFTVAPNITSHILITRSGSTNILYVNGTNTVSFENSTILTSCIYDIGWATTRNKSTAFYQGNIYGTKLYNRALTAAEVQQNFNATRGRFGI